ncbi:hypothetical protein LB505_013789 [Fusarium chuoi]|nr:hypothetical protein LB505_013789 [Fusarium chuoi]
MPFLARSNSPDQPSDFKPLYLGFDLSTQQLKGTRRHNSLTHIQPWLLIQTSRSKVKPRSTSTRTLATNMASRKVSMSMRRQARSMLPSPCG